ncbi:hypothetical protein SAMN05192575_10412 [Nocardioides alpinus]|uniref:Glycosyltransferase RgtA/B/C/D-like domain-containing protein n=1 Tax=Nocardioides alpinus TaxID=748909 RepID=A0A1I0YIU7_9ACTN|nr:hypothetical protein [Nocardioides alpinus]PKH43551.1 hypothetical protein CXG46_03610 [Nocardioides alpinus]SFB13289.1 hypothetical protein SAMN05192575_10412 [Nocardioides alpinus]
MAGNPTALGRVVWIAAAAAFVARFPGLLWPLRPDEAGFLLVARSWHPEPDSVYGHYFVDRPPPIIWLMQATDAIGGAYTHRVVGAVGCVLLVLASAAAAREMARRAGIVDPAVVRRVAGWVAVGTAALVSNAQIDPVAAKGELFGIPLVMGSCWLALRAVRRVSAADAFWAGLLAMSAVGFKQSIVGGLVFGAVLLVGSATARQVPWRAALRCAAGAVAGAAVPVLVIVGWALVVGVRLEALWYTSVSFRSDANRTIALQSAEGATSRISVLLLVFVGVGMLFLLACFVARLPALLRLDAVPVVAITAMLAVDLVAVAVSGSYWMPYLFVPIPALALALAGLMSHAQLDRRWHLVTPAAVAFAVASSVIALVGWTSSWVVGRVPVEVRTGEAIAASARPGDRVMVYGGRADIQWASRAGSPYPHLWSLPMRTLDPELEDLGAVLTGSNPPTWFVEATYINTWSELGTRPIEGSLIRKYEFIRTACGRYRVYRLNSVDEIDIDVDCRTPWRTIWGE